MKKVFVLFVIIVMSSCGIQYDAETRLEFKAKIIKSDGSPLPNSYVSVTVASGKQSDVISVGKSDNEGNITLFFPSPKSVDYTMEFSMYNEDLNYLERKIYNATTENFENFLYQFEPIILFRNEELVNLNLFFNQVNSNLNLESVSIEGLQNSDIANYLLDYYFDPYYQPFVYSVKKNQTIQLNYLVYNTSTQQTISNTIPLQIEESAVNYTLNY